MTVLVTGGAGYIGSHTIVSLLENDFDVIALDNLCNASPESLARVAQITGKSAELIEADTQDKAALRALFDNHQISAVIHFAALKAVGESTQIPLAYYQNNVHGTLCLLEVMREFDIRDFVFSSSATIYGEEAAVPYLETMQPGTPSSPYGASKVMVERALQDLCQAVPEFRAVSLRYFNPIGAHPSGKIGEDPKSIPNNLLPYIAQVAVGKLKQLAIFGNDYPTADGTCERDYLHVSDLAEGHVAALKWLQNNPHFRGSEAFNLGTGCATSVLEIVKAFEATLGRAIPYEFAPRRQGDLAAFWADASKAEKLLGWRANRSLADMMQDTIRWQLQNPDGYPDANLSNSKPLA